MYFPIPKMLFVFTYLFTVNNEEKEEIKIIYRYELRISIGNYTQNLLRCVSVLA